MKEIDKKDSTEISGGNMPPEPWSQPPVYPCPIRDEPFGPTDDPRCIPPTYPDCDTLD